MVLHRPVESAEADGRVNEIGSFCGISTPHKKEL